METTVLRQPTSFRLRTDLIEKLISEGKKVIRFPLNGTWIDIGNPQEYHKAQDLVKHLKQLYAQYGFKIIIK